MSTLGIRLAGNRSFPTSAHPAHRGGIVNIYTYDMEKALATKRMERYRAEAESHRLAKSSRMPRQSALERMAGAIGRTLVAMGESLRVDRRPRLPST